jgi:hypothetical protein
MKYYLTDILDVENIVDKLKEETHKAWLNQDPLKKIAMDGFKQQKFYVLTSAQRIFWEKLNGLVKICDFFGIEDLDINKENFANWLDCLCAPYDYAGELETILDDAFKNIKFVFQNAKTELSEKISLLEVDEKKRLNEAFNCYVQELNYSAIVMSVSAIESRLFSLMMSKCPDKKLEDLTLGQLIREYTEHKEKYGKVIPEKHEPLLDYCNVYRVFSVHPKKGKITRSIATSILCMACSFLFDKDLKSKVVEEKG